MTRPIAIATPLVFISGACALIYQVVWTRELRLVFGASTAASSAVIAIFIAGLGSGGLWWGRRIEHSPAPLLLYARLELAIAALSGATPQLLAAVRWLYVWSGGSLRLGIAGGSVLRLLLTAIVLGPPTWLMGGTLPALARTVEYEGDLSRRAVALMYGVNTLGALLGCMLSSFLFLEALGSRGTLFCACLVNALIAVAAGLLATRYPSLGPRPSQPSTAPAVGAASAHPGWVLASAAVVGFAFFLMELVWYRMLAPLLGGTVFTFGLILAVALAGIGLGSAAYAALWSNRPAALSGVAFSCAFEALCIAVPYALGDRLAISAALLRSLGGMGFGGLVVGWTLIAACVVLPAAVVAGFQFPLLISLLGSGPTHVARDVGRAYASNTLGAVAGALAGGFGLLPALGALGCWRMVSWLLVLWSALLTVTALAHGPRIRTLWVLAAAAATALCLSADGPSDAFRHSPIGAGRVTFAELDGPNAVQRFLTQQRSEIIWEADGMESAIGLSRFDGLGFVVNGKSDGNVRGDAATQVMGGLVGAALRPRIERAMVIGLGTGSTAGWLGQLPEIERVDVAEIEPAIITVARRCHAVNRDALNNPKLHIQRGDARELLSVSRERYDLIFSEPSNPYRAGVASLYTREFYAAVARRLAPDGVFVQWLQAYDVDTSTIQSVYATLGSEFAYVETWNGLHYDLFLVASRQPPVHDLARLKARLASEPFATALRVAWNTHGVEGFLAHYVANPSFTRACMQASPQRNTDDRSRVEFGFARTLRSDPHQSAESLFTTVQRRGQQRPQLRGDGVDWARVDFEREAFELLMGSGPDVEQLTPGYRQRLALLSKWMQSDFHGALAQWNAVNDADPQLHAITIERLALAEVLAYQGDSDSEPWIDRLLPHDPTLAAALDGVWLVHHGHRDQGSARLLDALALYRHDPWPIGAPMARALNALTTANDNEARSVRWLEALAQPFSAYVNETAREQARLKIAFALGAQHPACVAVLSTLEPHIPWQEHVLEFRRACYTAQHHPLRVQAEHDLEQFRSRTTLPFEVLLRR